MNINVKITLGVSEADTVLTLLKQRREAEFDRFLRAQRRNDETTTRVAMAEFHRLDAIIRNVNLAAMAAREGAQA